MRLLSVIHPPVFGGGHNQMIELAAPLAARGWETIALVPSEPGSAAERLRGAGIETITLPLHRFLATLSPWTHARTLGSLRREVGEIRALLRARGIDLVQVHGPTNPHAAIAADRAGVAVVWQLYDTRAPMPVRRLTMPLVVRIADAITTWGEELARVHPGARRLGERCITVFPPVDTQRFRPEPGARQAARATLNMTADGPGVVSVGNRNPSKGHEYLIRAASLVREREPAVQFRALGARSPAHDAYENELNAEIAARGLAHGAFEFFDAGARVADLLHAFDVFALASVPRSEGMPTALLEAMACALPVVATDVGAVRELVEHHATGFVVAPEDPDALAGRMVELIGDADLRRRMGERARTQAVERFDLERCADIHAHAYEIARAHRRSRD